MAEACRKRESLVYLCNPANPTGTTLNKDSVGSFLDLVPEHAIVVVDEAYAEYVDRPDYESCVRYVKQGFPNVVVLRTFSKLYGLAGLRVGYALGPKNLILAMSSHRLWNNINHAGAVAALVSFGDERMISAVRRQNAQVRRFFYEETMELDMEVIPSETSFVMLHVKRPAADMITAFKSFQVLIGRPIASLPEYVRITLGTKEEMKVFFEVFRKILNRSVVREKGSVFHARCSI
jgi:histidinol-phosphate aminotransferase